MAAWRQGSSTPPPCTSGSTPCPADTLDAQSLHSQSLHSQSLHSQSLHARWERAIARLQGAVACSPSCPLADHLLAVVADLGRTTNPLAEIFPELDPAPPRRHPSLR
ncbi:hypothetical protein ACM64Y_03520 [Novispirillum sp. DQ9]|uniref:hypothetical protein n=1 Tax=Novispirillum sp. DQ9 TaxID=3398612 RepID=UPI003C7E003B